MFLSLNCVIWIIFLGQIIRTGISGSRKYECFKVIDMFLNVLILSANCMLGAMLSSMDAIINKVDAISLL